MAMKQHAPLMKDYSRPPTVLALALLFVATLWIRPFEHIGGHLQPILWIGLAVLVWTKMANGGCGSRSRCGTG